MAGKQNTTKTQILEILEEHKKPMSAAEVAYRLDIPLKELRSDLDTLKAKRIVEEVGIERIIEELK